MIYFLVNEDGRCKIGWAGSDVPGRVRAHLSSYPLWKFYCAIEGSETNEKRIQKHFSKYRDGASREHFILGDELRAYIEWLGTRAFAVASEDGTIPPRREFERIIGYVVPNRFPWASGDYANDTQLILGDELVPGVRRPRSRSDRIIATVSSECDDWTTAPMYVEAARALMGGIDLDPATNPAANQIVKATSIWTSTEDGLSRVWGGRVWMNPPYGGQKGDWIARLVSDYEAGRIAEAVTCVNAHGTDSAWFERLWPYPICFTHHRPRFIGGAHDTDAVNSAPINGIAFVYLGPKPVSAFAEHFSAFGPIVQRAYPATSTRAEFSTLDQWAIKESA